jgi:hypothetical protein
MGCLIVLKSLLGFNGKLVFAFMEVVSVDVLYTVSLRYSESYHCYSQYNQ